MRSSLEAEFVLPSPLEEITGDERLRSTRVLLKRDDLMHPEITGNKWRKLKYLLRDADEVGATTLLTFGGAYSNHLRAVAAAGRRLGFDTIGVVRGDERPSNPGLRRAEADGMRLHYLDRATYRRKADEDVLINLRRRFGDFYLVPEGGTSVHTLPGCAEMLREIDVAYDSVVCAVGTGGTLAGIAAGLDGHRRAVGVSVLRGASSLECDVDRLHRAAVGRSLSNWRIDHRFHCGGFARRNSELDAFVGEFSNRHGIVLDRVYVAKAVLGLYRLIAEGEFASSTVVVVVSGRGDPSS